MGRGKPAVAPPGHGNGKEYAAHRAALGLDGTTPSAVSQAKSAGRISLAPNGFYCFADCDAQWAANTKSQHRGIDAPPAGPAPPPVAPAPHLYAQQPPAPLPALGPPSNGAQHADRRTWEAEEMYWRAQQRRMEAQKMASELVEVERAKLYVAWLFRGIRDELMSIPSRIRQTLASSDDPNQIEQILRAELRHALAEPNFEHGITHHNAA